MTRKVELFGHSSRVLYLAGSPLGGVVASTVEDEALRLWNVFETPKPTKPELPFADLIVAQRSLVELKWQHIFMEVWLQAPKKAADLSLASAGRRIAASSHLAIQF
ncbi:hypothetical protein MUK42_18856 [Musa troglodytarum]|uniref:Uncharacterized protein n=1 Tax=Musa troglodytarum TaxID=320322 RepID=A0A9E7I5G1_9LILI|nr:hypothetical protein MUK42_18856 [Musa troglodytarum]